MTEIGGTMSHYRILEKLGEGGMGVVYRAEDTNLGRQVAVKVLPDIFSGDPERLARFEREARLLASLSHQNIASIHGLEEADGKRFIVMELVEGETLAQRLLKGPLPVDEALEVCRQIAEGLEAAHEKGIIHRDLKPANIKITPEGKVKILDFGLAKAFQDETTVADQSQSPTITEAMTRAGVILGTAAYMSPEQARGKNVDKRTDIWAFGCILYECLTGKRAFEAEDVSDTLASVLARDPDWNALPPRTPAAVCSLLRRCLQKDRRRRKQDILDARIDMEVEDAVTAPAVTSHQAPVLPGVYTVRRRFMIALLLMTIVIGGTIGWFLHPQPEAVPQPVKHFAHLLPVDQYLSASGRRSLVISPDGSYIVYVANEQLYLRKIGEIEAHPIQGTDGGPTSPFFSPDSKSLGFWSSADSKLKRIAVTGGVAIPLCDAGNPYGVSWGSGHSIVFGQGATILQVSDEGGTPKELVRLESGETSYGPTILPGEKEVLFAVTREPGDDRWDKAQIVVQSLETNQRKTVIPAGSEACFVPTGHIVYAIGESLYAAPFDLAKLEVTGSAQQILDGVMRAAGALTGAANFSISKRGDFVYFPDGSQSQERLLTLVDRQGVIERLDAEPARYTRPRISPIGPKVAVEISSGGDSNVWIYDFKQNSWNQLTFDGGGFPCWTPDGKWVTYNSFKDGFVNIYRKLADSTGEPQPLLKSKNNIYPFSWTPGGDVLIYSEDNPGTGLDILSLSLHGEANPNPIIQTKDIEFFGVISPKGRWLAYYSTRQRLRDIYVQAFPNRSEGEWRISTEGGRSPRWSKDGNELFYCNRFGKIIAIHVATDGNTFSPLNPVPLPVSLPDAGYWNDWDVTPDGQKFLILQPKEESESVTQIHFVLNWFEELNQKVPTGK